MDFWWYHQGHSKYFLRISDVGSIRFWNICLSGNRNWLKEEIPSNNSPPIRIPSKVSLHFLIRKYLNPFGSESLRIWIPSYLNPFKIISSVLNPFILNPFISESLHFWIPSYLNPLISESLHIWIPLFLNPFISESLHVWIPSFLNSFLSIFFNFWIHSYLTSLISESLHV